MHRAAWIAWLFLVPSVLPAAGPRGAQAFDPVDIPPDLRPWIPWVLDGHDDLPCPLAGSRHVCIWPGTLELDIRDTGGTFLLWVRTDRPLAVPLPGGDGTWPRDVRVDGRALPIIEDGGQPVVRVEEGVHRVQGGWHWAHRPQRLKLPRATGLVALRLDGEPVPFPVIDGDGWVRLGAQERETPGHPTLQMEVARRLEDGVPFRVTTRLEIRASGRGREISFRGVLVPGTRPVSLSADLPARFEQDGSLTLQVRPGSFSVTFDAIHDGPVRRLVVPDPGGDWPEMEYWAVATNDQVRAVLLRGLSGVDPARTSLPKAWRGLPAYIARPGQSLTFEEIRRGEPEPPPNRLELTRVLWLDQDGQGMTIRDTFAGTMSQGWRLDILPPANLGHVVDHGLDQVVTRAHDLEGVELRHTDVQLVAESRIDAPVRELEAVGWDTDVVDLQATIHLPPGWSLFATTGTDGNDQTRVGAWTLFDLFFVLVVAIAAWRLLGWPWGLVALVGLALSRHDPSAPRWIWPTLLATLALLRVVPADRSAHRVVRGFKYVFLASLYVIMVSYLVGEVRKAIAPVLERPWVSTESMGAAVLENAQEEKRTEPRRMREALPAGAPAMEWKAKHLAQDLVRLSAGAPSERLYQQSLQQDPSAVVQTGPGVPSWRWDTYRLYQGGAATSEQTMHLYLISPTLNRALIVVKVALLLVLALRLAETKWRQWWRRRGIAVLLPATVLALLMPVPARAAAKDGGTAGPAGWPSSDLLGELEQRLTRPPDCAPNCVTVAETRLEVGASTLTVTDDVHADAESAYPLLGPASVWVPARVLVDGHPTTDLARLDDGFLHVRLPRGVARVTIEGPLPETDALTLKFGVLPKRLTWTSQAWTVSGVHADATVDRAIQLTRLIRSGKGHSAGSTENLAPWVQVERVLDLGIPWQVVTTVSRVGPSTTPLALRVPLLDGEAVVDADLEVRDHAVQVALDRSQTRVSWHSTLAQQPEIVLRAPTGVPWNERWKVLCSPVFSCHFEGLTPLRHVAEGRWAPEWWPWPGEQVTLSVTRPEAVAGQTLTVDSARLTYRPGKRMAETTLSLHLRSSRGGQQTIVLPEQARVQKTTVDGRTIPVQATRGSLPVPVQPGSHTVTVVWQQSTSSRLVDRAPRVDVGSPGVNATVAVEAPPNRWILWLEGPDVGPVALFWSLIVVVLIAAPIARRVPYTPLKTWQWVLLGLGMVALSPYAPLMIILWFAALGYRRKHPPAAWYWFDLYQLALIVLTMVALGTLYATIHHGLLGNAPAYIQGNGSSESHLLWYVDRIDGVLPQPAVWSVPMWVWRVVMLAWSLWLAWSLVRWLPDAWHAFADGGTWRTGPRIRRRY